MDMEKLLEAKVLKLVEDKVKVTKTMASTRGWWPNLLWKKLLEAESMVNSC